MKLRNSVYCFSNFTLIYIPMTAQITRGRRSISGTSCWIWTTSWGSRWSLRWGRPISSCKYRFICVTYIDEINSRYENKYLKWLSINTKFAIVLTHLSLFSFLMAILKPFTIFLSFNFEISTMPSISIRIFASHWVGSCWLTTLLGVDIVVAVFLTFTVACSKGPANLISPSFGYQLDSCANLCTH